RVVAIRTATTDEMIPGTNDPSRQETSEVFDAEDGICNGRNQRTAHPRHLPPKPLRHADEPGGTHDTLARLKNRQTVLPANASASAPFPRSGARRSVRGARCRTVARLGEHVRLR